MSSESEWFPPPPRVYLAPHVYSFATAEARQLDPVFLEWIRAQALEAHDPTAAWVALRRCQAQLDPKKTPWSTQFQVHLHAARQWVTQSQLRGLSSSEVDLLMNAFQHAHHVFPHCAEPFHELAQWCNHHHRGEQAYTLLHQALALSWEVAVREYPNTSRASYGLALHEDLAVACGLTGRFHEGWRAIRPLLDHPEWVAHQDRLLYHARWLRERARALSPDLIPRLDSSPDPSSRSPTDSATDQYPLETSSSERDGSGNGSLDGSGSRSVDGSVDGSGDDLSHDGT
jgi:hypothetical protein